MNSNPQFPRSEEAPEEQVNSRDRPDIPFMRDLLSTPDGYSSGVENQLQPWEYEQLGSELEQFMEQLEHTPCESAVAQTWQQQPTDFGAYSSASSSNPDNQANGPQLTVPEMFKSLQQNSSLEHFNEASLPLSTELLLAYSSMLIDLGPSAMPGPELQPADLSFLDAMDTHVLMLLEGNQSVMDLTDGEMSPWERVEQEPSDWSEWEQVNEVEHSDRSDWEQVGVEHSDRSDSEQCATDFESTTSNSTSEQEEASAVLTASKEKRGRTNISHQRKLEIIAFCNANRHLTSHQQSKELGVVRTTMINILSQQKKILMRPTATNALTLQKELLRPSTTVASSRLHIMDLLLCAWIKELRDQYIPVPDEKVRWQAFAVHRMLSGLTNEPLPPCAFSNGWMDKFKVRMALKMEKADPLLFVKNDSDEMKELRQLLHRYALEDIYTCDVTSIFALPGCILKHPKQAYRLQQYAPGNFGTQVNGAKDAQRVVFQNWLTTFDRQVQRESLLLISEDTWEQVRGKLSGLERVKVAVVPKHLNAWLPMRAGIAREFKSHINAINFERTLDPGKFSEGDIYSMAMHDIDSSVITDCFKRFSAAAHWLKKGRPRDIKSPDKHMKRGKSKDTNSAVILTDAQERLKSVFLSAHKDAKTKEHVLLYYLNQDSDIGPSAFLCSMIERMHLRSDVEPYLNPSGLGIRKESWWSHVVITSGTPQAETIV
ncbi:hypothetical protein BGZ70_000319 [Mortierella alpina]|uniref:HTH CENPB-type domain-containing protein n=1 Tax=Mortierella alpina TaxID=64518 RepID=A0A9P6IY26_MORAP|nr:hypothetical protein BGZ70_000319 [Mortierella alpina]